MNLSPLHKKLEQLENLFAKKPKVIWLNTGEDPAGDPGTMYIRWQNPGDKQRIVPLSLGRHA